LKDIAINDLRSFVILGHTGSGKTTLCDALLFKLGLSDRLGLVSNGTSASDYTEEEIGRKSSVYAKVFSGVYADGGKKNQVVMIDSPGVDDFVGQVICACRAVNAALITVDASGGIQVGTAKMWRRCQTMGLARGIVITGLDKENSSFAKAVADIQNTWGAKCIPVIAYAEGKLIDVLAESDIPATAKELVETSRNALIECAAEGDDAMLEKYLGGEKLTNEEIQTGLRRAVLKGSLFPVFAVMALKNVGVAELLKKIVAIFPTPADEPVKDAQDKPVNPAPDAPFIGHVWRIVTDPYAGKLAYVRICGGTLKENTEVFNVTKGHKERIGALLVKEHGTAVGIITDQDIVRHFVAKGINPLARSVRDLRAKELITISPEADIYDALVTMRDHGIRHLPVMQGRELIGLLTLKDILKVEPQLFDIVVEKYEIMEEGRKARAARKAMSSEMDEDELEAA